MKIGTIGTSFITKFMLDRISKVEGVCCEAIYSRTYENGKKLAEEFGVHKIYTVLDEMLQDSEINFIYVASPNSLHYEQVKKALLAGKNVICEKPFTPTVKEAKELVALAKEKKLFLIEAITTLYHPHFEWIKEHMSDIGDLKMISCTFCQYSSRFDDLKNGKVTNVFNPKFAGGALMDINMYNLEFVVGLLGRPDYVEYLDGKYENKIDTHGIVIMKYGDVICQCTGAKDTWCDNNAQIMGDKGYMVVTPGSNNCKKVRLVRKSVEDVIVEVEEDQWYHEVKELVKLVNNNDYETCYKNLENTIEVVRILEKCR